jgi:PhnB protein
MATSFAPHLYLRILSPAIAFYTAAFNAVELRRWSNPDGSVHVAEMSLDGALFHLHEERPDAHQLSPETTGATSSQIGLFVEDPDRLFAAAVEAGGRVISPPQTFDYGYRQGVVADPYGHQWLIQKKVAVSDQADQSQ